MEFLIFVGCVVALFYVFSLWETSQKYNAMKPKVDSLEMNQRKLIEDRKSFDAEQEKYKQERDRTAREWDQKVKNDKDAIILLSRQKSMGFPWLANAYADLFSLEDKQVQTYLELKKRPARAAAEEVKEAARRRREAEFRYRLSKYKIEYYESLFPWLTELIAESEDEDQQILSVYEGSAESKEDAASKWLTAEEYSKLPAQQKYQKALERYASRKKTSWEIGRDYERYIGFLWESEGYQVSYHGALEGFEDMGRDLIAIKGSSVEIIQCKYWSQHKTIHEKHIFQLFGTTIEYWMALDTTKEKTIEAFIRQFSEYKVVPVFVTSTILSETARRVAKALNVEVHEQMPYAEYPRIKCNVSGRDREKIYHLPFDQQYDRVLIEPEKGESYASTVAEAEKKGFRRAFRWRG